MHPRHLLKKNGFAAFTALFAISLTTSAFAGDPAKLRQRLQAFKQNSAQAMKQIPEKRSRSGKKTPSKFSKAEIQSRNYVLAKNKFREVLSGRSAFKSSDDPAKLVDFPEEMLTSIEDMDTKKLMKGEVKTQPWSDYYWSLFNGQTAYRYADTSFPQDSEDWKLKNEYMTSDASKNTRVDLLSPAEKYDLIVGDERKSLTNSALSEGGSYYRQSGKVETWMGICHGWAPAAYMMDRPTKSVKVMAADGKTEVTFYPADIKALASLLWAEASPDTKFIGGRCNEKDPDTEKSGRVKDQDCFDTNPGAWHLAIVNQVGVKKRSFVLDATYDYEVWNQPVHSYSYTFFNPKTMEPAKNLKEALVKIEDFTDDKFEKHRSKRSKFVVGVSMDMSYVVETHPKQAKTDGNGDDALKEVSYEYDLELDENMNIIGGEWYNNNHPDFLWTPEPDARAVSAADEILESSGDAKKKWNGKEAMPREWSTVAPKASEKGVPLATIVEALIKLSRGKLDI
jgi:hypothetical protein